MKPSPLFICALFISIFTFSSCSKKDHLENTAAIWLWGKHMDDAPLKQWEEKGIEHIFLLEKAFDVHSEEYVYDFIKECNRHDMKVHIWFLCFGKDRKWRYPIDTENKCIRQESVDSVINRAVEYVKNGFDGVHLDYIRFAGNAHKYNYPETGLTGTSVVTEFCRQISTAVKAVKPDAILSAAVMPEINSEHLYGQNPNEMGKWIDVLVPMIYRYGYAGKDMSLEWVKETTEWFVNNSGEAKIWAGTQTYTVNLEDNSPIDMSAEAIISDCRDFKEAGVDGISFFRHRLGEIPDMNDFWKE